MKKGFTLIEVLIVITIIILLSIFILISLQGQMAHATDSRRKTDLYTLSKSFEDYYNDKSAFPAQSVVNDCGGALAPYIPIIPCDPVHRTDHYGYFPAANGGYRICAKLTDTTDPAIAASGCGGATGCGLGGPASGGVYNYCLSSGVTASAVGTVDEIAGGGGTTPTPGGGTPTPGDIPGYSFACAKVDYLGNSYCKSYIDPITQWHCPKSYSTPNCDNECQTHPEVRCP